MPNSREGKSPHSDFWGVGWVGGGCPFNFQSTSAAVRNRVIEPGKEGKGGRERGNLFAVGNVFAEES